ncbi:MAG TPA: helix-turn-helix transcriptional regulator [Actinokineospora sp.]|nr:helix-turn-helix transcriptional regulator [Actinokineospora sp.]
MNEELPARRRALGAELAALRVNANLTTVDAAKRIATSAATLNRIENAHRAARIDEVTALLAVYQVVGKRRSRIIGLVEDVQSPGWLEDSQRLEEMVEALVQFESQAASMVHFAPSNVPGLLQTPRYAGAIMGDGLGEDAEKLLAGRMDRQKVLYKLGAPSYTAILDESVLRRPMGGRFVMADQIRWLIDCAKLPNVDIRVIPFKYGGYSSPGDFTVFDFRDAPTLVYIEHSGAWGFLHSQDATGRLQGIATKLMRMALDSTDSVKFLTMMAADHDRS